MLHRSEFFPAESSSQSVGVFSWGMLRIPFLETMVGWKLCRAETVPPRKLSAIAGWGQKPTTRRAQIFAAKHRLPYFSFEDGFLRSYGTGDRFPPLSIVVDDEGIYYDSTRSSSLESLLNSQASLLEGIADDVFRARDLILQYRLSKYNHAPELQAGSLRESDKTRVLVIDQTVGDMSVVLGGADERTFAAMLAAARMEHPEATIYVKTHPEVVSGRKRGYLSHVTPDERTVVLRDAVNPLGLIAEMDRVYCVSSTMGFEALLAGKPVSCFAMPWYAGWGVTDDRQRCSRRQTSRSVDELFAAAYFHYARYFNPVTFQQGNIFDVIEWLIRQKCMSEKYTGKMMGVGFRKWKAANVRPMLSLRYDAVHFVKDDAAAGALSPEQDDAIIVWGKNVGKKLKKLSKSSGARLLRMEDGFVRSVGLGSDLIRPMSLVLDERGIYFDPSRPSDLEHILNTSSFSLEEITEAERARDFIVQNGITKYNTDLLELPSWKVGSRSVVFVPGQVEDDASIRFGCGEVKTNRGLLEAVRRSHPDAFVVYKPHPDVLTGNRRGEVDRGTAVALADRVETGLSVVSCIEACDEVHTMTSLSGFDALLRNKRVVTYGQPFYAGWGLTDDRFVGGEAFKRRERNLSVSELVAGVLLRYPFYWDHDLVGYTSCMAVLRKIVRQREYLEVSGGIEKLRSGYLRRQFRKLSILLGASFEKF